MPPPPPPPVGGQPPYPPGSWPPGQQPDAPGTWPPGQQPNAPGTWQPGPQPGQPGNWQPGQQLNQPARPQPRPAPTAPPRQELRHRAAAAAVFGLLSLLSLAVAGQVKHVGYLVAFSLAVGVIGCGLGISASRRARREDTTRPRGAVASVIVGAVSIVLALLTLVGLIFAHQLTDYEQCVNNAHSTSAQQTCTRQLLHSIGSHFGQNN
jgi:hypothetical protein